MIVPDDQLSLAIGRDGQNARLAARLTGWRVDIKSETEFAQEDEEIGYEGEEDVRRPLHGGADHRPPLPERRAAGLALLRPAPAPGARALRDQPGRRCSPPLDEAEVAMLADPDADEGQVDRDRRRGPRRSSSSRPRRPRRPRRPPRPRRSRSDESRQPRRPIEEDSPRPRRPTEEPRTSRRGGRRRRRRGGGGRRSAEDDRAGEADEPSSRGRSPRRRSRRSGEEAGSRDRESAGRRAARSCSPR